MSEEIKVRVAAVAGEVNSWEFILSDNPAAGRCTLLVNGAEITSGNTIKGLCLLAVEIMNHLATA